MKLALSFLFLSTTAFGADIAIFSSNLSRIAAATTPEARDLAINQILNRSQDIVTAALAPSQAKIVAQYRMLRSDSQTGASSDSSGSTSLVLNPYLADILGFSFESGSVLKTVSGNTINLQIKPAGIFCAVKNEDGSDAALGTGCLDFWKRVGITASFDKSRSNAPSQLIALQDDFSQLRFHIDLMQPSVKRAKEEVTRLMAAQAEPASRVALLFATNSALIQWNAEARAMLVEAAAGPTEAAREKALEDAWRTALDRFSALLQIDPGLRAASPPLATFANLNVETNLRTIVLEKLERTSLAFEASWDRPDVAKADVTNGIIRKGLRPPDLGTARLIYSKNYQPLVITANAEASWFNKTFPGMKGNFRNWHISAAATFLLREVPNFGRTTLSFGGLIGDLHQQPLGFDYTVPLVSDPTKTQKIDLSGWIRAFNTRLEFPTANKSITIPISFTYANRTDLNKETEVRGSIGLTLRFDSFFPAK